MIVGGYTLDLYCDGARHKELHPEKYDSVDESFFGVDFSDCRKQARAKGWVFKNDKNTVVCRVCSEAGKTRAS